MLILNGLPEIQMLLALFVAGVWSILPFKRQGRMREMLQPKGIPFFPRAFGPVHRLIDKRLRAALHSTTSLIAAVLVVVSALALVLWFTRRRPIPLPK
jgi:hypothetical protein